MIPLQAYLAAGTFLAGVATGWTVQGWHYQAKENDRAQQELADRRLQATARVRREEAVIAAQNDAQARARALRLDADGSRAALVGLHDATAQAMRDAAAAHDACTERAHALSVVLNQCGAAYQELGAVADRHASDVKTLTEAWPR